MIPFGLDVIWANLAQSGGCRVHKALDEVVDDARTAYNTSVRVESNLCYAHDVQSCHVEERNQEQQQCTDMERQSEAMFARVLTWLQYSNSKLYQSE